MARKQVPAEVEMQVLTLSRRRCYLCFWLDGNEDRVKGQIAHLDQNPEHSDFDNLVWLCLNHHDEYDGRTSVSKGLKEAELRHYRDRLYKEMDWDEYPPAQRANESIERPGNRTAARAMDGEQERPRFLDYLDGLSGDELYRMATAVLVDQSQTIDFYPAERICDTLVHKGLLEKVPVRQTLEQFSKRAPTPHTFPPAVWLYLNGHKAWLLQRAIERNQDQTLRLAALNKIKLG
jgi:hypothetical protein